MSTRHSGVSTVAVEAFMNNVGYSTGIADRTNLLCWSGHFAFSLVDRAQE
jgi:hypothetical protein